MCDIQRLGGQIAKRLAHVSDDTDAFRFDTSSVPSLPRSLTSDRMVIQRGYHYYNGCWRADQLHLYATRRTLRALGVIVLASLFAAPDRATDIALTHRATDIRTLRVKTPSPGVLFARTPAWYDYRPQDGTSFPGTRRTPTVCLRCT